MEKINLFTSNFNKFYKFIFLLAFLLGSLGWLWNIVFENYIIFSCEISGASKINRILSEQHGDETPIFGSSRAEGSYIPSIIGENYYNYGISGTQAFIWLYFLEEELKKDKKSDIIINFDLGGFLYSNGDIGNYIPNYPLTKELMLSENKFYYSIPFIKYFGKFESYLKYYLNEKINLTKYTDKGGSFEKNVLTEKKFEELIELRRESSDIYTVDSTLLKEFRSLILSTNRRIYLIIAPYHKSYLKSFKNLKEAEYFLNQVSKITNLTVLDLKDSITNDSLYMNTTHINYSGAKVFSKKLKELLEKEDK